MLASINNDTFRTKGIEKEKAGAEVHSAGTARLELGVRLEPVASTTLRTG